MANPLRELYRLGQSVWLDQLSRDWLPDTLQSYVERDGITGVTTNPAIFRQALASSRAYDEPLRAAARTVTTAAEALDLVLLEDICRACDVLARVYESSGGTEGYVSHEVSPLLAMDEWATIEEASRLWKAIDRPNALIKIPATDAGLRAIRRCLAEGIKVNVTLIFSWRQYARVADVYLSALEDRLAMGGDLANIVSVASLFVSRVDTHVDAELDRLIATLPAGSARAGEVRELQGRAAVANGCLAYEHFQKLVAGERFRRLAHQGARAQRLLWASTSTKNPAYSDVKYVEELAVRETINTIPLSTLEAFRDHGCVRAPACGDFENAHRIVTRLAELGIDLDAVGEELQRQGVDAFVSAYQANLEAVAAKLGWDA